MLPDLRRPIGNAARRAGLMMIAGVFGLVAVAFLTVAAAIALAQAWGCIAAALVLGAVYAVFALGFVLAASRKPLPPPPPPQPAVNPARAQMLALALMTGFEVATSIASRRRRR